LNEVEEKEHEELAGGKTSKGKLAAEDKGSKKNKLMIASDSLPSPAAIRVIPKYDDILKKAEKAAAAQENKGKRTVSQITGV